MNPEDIKLHEMSKEFEYVKFAQEVDTCDDLRTLKDMCKYAIKMYLKQQEVSSEILKHAI